MELLKTLEEKGLIIKGPYWGDIGKWSPEGFLVVKIWDRGDYFLYAFSKDLPPEEVAVLRIVLDTSDFSICDAWEDALFWGASKEVLAEKANEWSNLHPRIAQAALVWTEWVG